MDMDRLLNEFSSVSGMGAPKQVFPVKWLSKWGIAILGVIFIIGSILLGSVMFFDLFGHRALTISHYDREGLFAAVIPGGIMLLIGGLILFGAFRNWKKALAIYENGFAYRDRKGIVSCRWDELSTMNQAVTRHYTNGIYTGTTHMYTIFKNDSTKIVLNDTIKKIEDVFEMIRQPVFPLLYARYADAYNTGKAIVFGPVSMSRDAGITVGKKSYPWGDVAAVSLKKGYLSVAKKGGGFFSGATAAAAAIPNLDVLISIINQVVGISAG